MRRKVIIEVVVELEPEVEPQYTERDFKEHVRKHRDQIRAVAEKALKDQFYGDLMVVSVNL